MRFYRASLLLGCIAVAAVATVAYCCGDYGGSRKIILANGAKLPAGIDRCVISGDLLVALLPGGKLTTVDLKTREVKDLGNFDMKLAGLLDVADGKACVASKNRVYVIDLAAGKIVRAAVCEHDVHALGFIGPQRVYVQNGPLVNVLDLTSGKTIHAMELGKSSPKAIGMGFHTLGRSGNRLFVSVGGDKSGVTILDLGKGEVSDRIAAPEIRLGGMVCGTDFHAAGDKLYILCSRFSYGVWTDSFGYVDLKTRKYTGLKLPSHTMHQTRLIPGPDGTLFLAGVDGVFQYDAGGKLRGTVLAKNEGRMLGVWSGNILIAQNEELQRVRLSQVAAQGQ